MDATKEPETGCFSSSDEEDNINVIIGPIHSSNESWREKNMDRFCQKMIYCRYVQPSTGRPCLFQSFHSCINGEAIVVNNSDLKECLHCGLRFYHSIHLYGDDILKSAPETGISEERIVSFRCLNGQCQFNISHRCNRVRPNCNLNDAMADYMEYKCGVCRFTFEHRFCEPHQHVEVSVFCVYITTKIIFQYSPSLELSTDKKTVYKPCDFHC